MALPGAFVPHRSETEVKTVVAIAIEDSELRARTQATTPDVGFLGKFMVTLNIWV